MITVQELVKEVEVGKRQQPILRDVSLKVKRGEFVLITGKSGSGKSTLLNMLSGVDTPSAGKVQINGQEIQDMNEKQIAMWRGKNMGIVFQFFQLIPTLSVIENILLAMDLVDVIPGAEREKKAMQLLQAVGMEMHADKMPGMLSGGEQQRVAIARALANDVNLIIADEPTGNLDSANADTIFMLLERLNHQGKTIVMVTHERETLKGATRKITMKDGRIIDDVSLAGGEPQ